MAEDKKSTQVAAPLLLPASRIPPKSPDLISAYKMLGFGPFCDGLDQLRAQFAMEDKKMVARIDAAIQFLVLDMGYDAEELAETLEVAVNELVAEANIFRAKRDGKEAF